MLSSAKISVWEDPPPYLERFRLWKAHTLPSDWCLSYMCAQIKECAFKSPTQDLINCEAIVVIFIQDQCKVLF